MSKPRVLIIDDDPMITHLLEEHLSQEGYEIQTVHLAEQGYQLGIASSPDLIFLDVMLPDATGFQTVARFRQHAATSATPIIMMSGTARNANQLEIAKGMGATAYVLKPFDVIAVGEQVKKLIKNKPAPAKGIETAPEPAIVPEPRIIHRVESLPPPPLAPKYNSRIELIPMHELQPREPLPEEPKTDPFEEPLQAWTLPDRPSVESLPPLMPEELKSSTIDIQNDIPLETPPFTLPDSGAHKKVSPQRSWGCLVALLMFAAHVTMTVLKSENDVLKAVSFTAGGWALLLGCLVAVCALLQIPLEASRALSLEGWAAIPIVLRAWSVWRGLTVPLPPLPSIAFWTRPLDLFELAGILILGLLIRRTSGSSLVKTLFASVLIAAIWSFTARGFFHPF